MTRRSIPAIYSANAPSFGLSEWDHARLEPCYYLGPKAVDELAEIGRAMNAEGAMPVGGYDMTIVQPMLDNLAANEIPVRLVHDEEETLAPAATRVATAAELRARG